MRPGSTVPDSTRLERPISAQPVVGDPAVMDPGLISQPDHDDKPAAPAERTWLEQFDGGPR